MCNQAASFNRCILKVQQNMRTQLKTIRAESKGKSASKVITATYKLQYFNGFQLEYLSSHGQVDGALTNFENMTNLTLLRRDSY